MRRGAYVTAVVLLAAIAGCGHMGLGGGSAGMSLTVTPGEPMAAPKKALSVEVPARGGRDVTIDGVIGRGEWPAEAAIDLARGLETQEGQWSGPDDLSAKLYFMVDAENLYLAIDVTDDVHDQAEAGQLIWQGDSVQLAFDPLHNPETMRHRVDDYEYGFALTSKGPVVWRWKSGPGKSDGETSGVPMVAKKRDGGIVYEAAIPFGELSPIAPLVRPDCGFTVAINDADGSGRGSYLEWTPGIVSSKDDSAFGELRFAYMPPAERDVLITLDIQRIFADDGQDFSFTVGANAKKATSVDAIIEVVEDDQMVTSAGAKISVPKGISWHVVSLPTETLQPARYVLHVTVKGADGAMLFEQDFTVYRYSSKRDSSW